MYHEQMTWKAEAMKQRIEAKLRLEEEEILQYCTFAFLEFGSTFRSFPRYPLVDFTRIWTQVHSSLD